MDWLARFPTLAQLDDPAWKALVEESRVVHVPSGTVIFHDGDPCRQYLLVLDGSVRVQKTAASGREITLYRVEAGQSCVLTTSCLLAGDAYPAEGVTESDVIAVSIPIGTFEKGLAGSDGFRKFVFTAYGRRIANLIVLVEAIAFERLDRRMAEHLLNRCDGNGELATTHQSLAADLGTAREVVSRQLKDFERRGWIALQRGRIRLNDARALSTLLDRKS